MRHRLLIVLVTVLIITGSIFSSGASNLALANNHFEERMKDIQQERSETQKEVKKTEAEITKIEEELKQINIEIEKIDNEVAETNQKIREKREEIEEVAEQIEEVKEEIAILEDRIAERDELLKDRARSMYQNGGAVNYLEVLLGAKSFGDLLDRVSALAMIAQQDRSILEAHIKDQQDLEEAKVLVEEKLQVLESHLTELEALMARLEDNRKQKETIMKNLEQKENELHGDLGELEGADKILAAQERAIKQELEAYQERQRQKELERQRELERQQQAERVNSQSQNSQSSSSTPSSSSRNNSTPSSANNSTPASTGEGQFMRPATGSITSEFGMRWGRLHAGIDIGKNGRTGDVPIVAAEAGTVVRSYYSSSYGNTVIISHNVNGKLITTLYAHMENRFVSDGERVSKGQKLGYMGNTGQSFGPHLHFEVHEGPWNGQVNAVDPFKYIPR